MRVTQFFVIILVSTITNSTWSNQETSFTLKSEDKLKFDMIFTGGTKIPMFDVSETDVSTAEFSNQASIVIPSVHNNPRNIDLSNYTIPVLKEVVVPPLDDVDLPSEQNSTEVSETNNTQTNENITELKDNNITTSQIPEVRDDTTIDVNTKTKDVNSTVVENKTIQDKNVSKSVLSIPKNPKDLSVSVVDDPIFDVHEIVPEKIDEVVPELTLQINDWDTATDFGFGWKTVDWFGSYFNPSNESHINYGSWIFHAKLGWMYIKSDSFDSVWIWSDLINGWGWTNDSTFGYIYLDKTDTWILFDSEKNLIYDFYSEKYIDIN